jgi:hypothetical protein
MFCVGIFLQNEDCKDSYLIFRLVQYIIKSGVFSLHIFLFCSDTTILCFPLVIGTVYISSPLVSFLKWILFTVIHNMFRLLPINCHDMKKTKQHKFSFNRKKRKRF